MKITRVSLHNFGSFRGSHAFDLRDRGLLLIMGDNRDEPRLDSNGSGKSTLVEALDWCLFGVVPRGDHVDSVINDAEGSGCWVRVDLEDDGEMTLSIERRRKCTSKTPGVSLECQSTEAGGLSLWRNEGSLTTTDMRETQKRIEQELGLSRDVFHAAVLFGQTDLLRFADASDSQRLDLVTEVLGLREIDAALEIAKARQKSLEAEYQAARSDLDRIQAQIEGVASQDLSGLSAQWESTRQADVKAAEANIAAYAEQERVQTGVTEWAYERLQAASAASDVAYHAMESSQAFDSSSYDTTLADAAQKIANAGAGAAVVRAEIARLDTEIRKAQDLGEGDCETCGQRITEHYLADRVARLQASRQDQAGKLATYEGPLDQWQKYAAKVKAQLGKARADYQAGLEASKRALHEAQRAWEAEKAMADQAARELDAVARQLQVEQAKLAATRKATNPYEAGIRQQQDQIKALTAKKEDLGKQAREKQEALAYADFWKKGFGPQGLKSYILDTRLGAMTDESNRWIKLLFGGTVWVRFETQKATRSGTLQNKINIRVFRHNPDGSITERNYKSWSGGEKHRIALGIDFGLSRLIAARARKSYDLLILDELFRHLDRAGRDAVVDMLHQLRRDRSTVVVIDHATDLQGAFEHRITVTKQDGASRIVEAGDGSGQEASYAGKGISASNRVEPQSQAQCEGGEGTTEVQAEVLPAKAPTKKRRTRNTGGAGSSRGAGKAVDRVSAGNDHDSGSGGSGKKPRGEAKKAGAHSDA